MFWGDCCSRAFCRKTGRGIVRMARGRTCLSTFFSECESVSNEYIELEHSEPSVPPKVKILDPTVVEVCPYTWGGVALP